MWAATLLAAMWLFGSVVASASTYYLSPKGDDYNNGQSIGSAWLSPNHSLNCGDVIIAAPGTNYSAANFFTGRWGKVNCPAANNVAWLKCASFDACKISASSYQGMWVDQSYWGVSGFEATASSTDEYGTCFLAEPSYSHPTQIHHIIFADNVANGCQTGGFASIYAPGSGTFVGVDYLVIIGNIAYNAAKGTNECASGISVNAPTASDTSAGTHIYVAGNFSYANFNPPICGGTASTDGEGIIIDTPDSSQTRGKSPYTQQIVVDNNLVAGNGSWGIEVFNNSAGTIHAPIYFRNNTAWGDMRDRNQNKEGSGEIFLNRASSTTVSDNLTQTFAATALGDHPIYALAIGNSNITDSVSGNFADGVSGNNTFSYNNESFAYGSNILGTSPGFTNPTIPGAPQCEGKGDVPSCMASVISDFKPRQAAARLEGYQPVRTKSVSDPLFPKWLCNVNLPAGLVTMGCN